MILKKSVEQWFFECFKLKQKFTMLWNEGILKELSSMVLGIFQISICHCYALEKTEHEMILQLGFDGSKDSQMMAR